MFCNDYGIKGDYNHMSLHNHHSKIHIMRFIVCFSGTGPQECLTWKTVMCVALGPLALYCLNVIGLYINVLTFKIYYNFFTCVTCWFRQCIICINSHFNKSSHKVPSYYQENSSPPSAEYFCDIIVDTIK